MKCEGGKNQRCAFTSQCVLYCCRSSFPFSLSFVTCLKSCMYFSSSFITLKTNYLFWQSDKNKTFRPKKGMYSLFSFFLFFPWYHLFMGCVGHYWANYFERFLKGNTSLWGIYHFITFKQYVICVREELERRERRGEERR